MKNFDLQTLQVASIITFQNSLTLQAGVTFARFKVDENLQQFKDSLKNKQI